MQNLERQRFEDEWRSAFDGAEMVPSDGVWHSIDAALADVANEQMRRRVIFYQSLAAAMVILALATGIYAFYQGRGNEKFIVKGQTTSESNSPQSTQPNTTEQVDGNSADQSSVSPSVTENTNEITSTAGHTALNQTTSKHTYSGRSSSNHGTTSSSTSSFDITKSMALQWNNSFSEKGREGKQTGFNPEMQSPKQEDVVIVNSDAVVADANTEELVTEQVITQSPLLLTENKEPETVVEPRKAKGREKGLWLAFGGAAGGYKSDAPGQMTNATFSGANVDLMATPAQTKSQSVTPKSGGQTYSVGLSVGKRVGKRIILQSGINYISQLFQVASNRTSVTAYNIQEVYVGGFVAKSADANMLAFTDSYLVNNSLQVVSVPVQAGYMIIDRRLGLQVNTGVSPDFFIRNVLTAQTGDKTSVVQSAGGDSPYRTVNYSALLNTELSYRIGHNYRVSLVPGLRYTLRSQLKQPSYSTSPYIFDVGFRFRYMFE